MRLFVLRDGLERERSRRLIGDPIEGAEQLEHVAAAATGRLVALARREKPAAQHELRRLGRHLGHAVLQRRLKQLDTLGDREPSHLDLVHKHLERVQAHLGAHVADALQDGLDRDRRDGERHRRHRRHPHLHFIVVVQHAQQLGRDLVLLPLGRILQPRDRLGRRGAHDLLAVATALEHLRLDLLEKLVAQLDFVADPLEHLADELHRAEAHRLVFGGR